MIIPIIHRRKSAKFRILFISLILTFIVAICFLSNSELITAIGYSSIEYIAIGVLILHISILSVFLFSKKFSVVGKLSLLDSGFEIKLKSGENSVFIKEIARFKIIINGYKGLSTINSSGKILTGLDNFIVIQNPNNTSFYEFILNSRADFVNLLNYFKNAEYPGIIDMELNPDLN